MSEKSGIDILKDLLNGFQLLSKRVEIIEQNTKEILNRANGFENKKFTISPAQKPEEKSLLEPQKISSNKQTSTKVIGKVKNKEGKFLSGVRIRIFDDQNRVVKETKTNKAGEFMSFYQLANTAWNIIWK